MAVNLESRSSAEDSGVLMIGPCLDYINEILMEEGMDDAADMQQVDDASYQAIFSSFHDVLGDHLPPHSNDDSSIYENVFDPHLLHESGHVEHLVNDPLKSTQIIPQLHEMKNDMYISGSRLNSNSLNETNVSLSSNKGSTASRNDGVLMDAMVSCWGIVDGLRSHVGQGQGNGMFKLPSADEEFSSKLAEVNFSFEDLKLDDVYSGLYVGEPSSSTGAAANSTHKGDKKKYLAGRAHKFPEKRTSEVTVFEDVREVLVRCAQAVAIGDARRANEILQELRQVHGASANGTSLQRTAHYFSKALAVRMRGMGEHEFKAMLPMPSAATILRITKLGIEVSPFVSLMHYFANQSIIKAAEGASRLHIVDYGILYGMQWPCLINALADQKGGPPLLVITGIEFPRSGVNMAERLDGTGRRLSAYAKTYSVPFKYHAIVTSKWEDLDAASLHCHEGEVLVVNCVQRLRHLADDSADLASTIAPRQKLLASVHSLHPQLLVTVDMSAEYNSTFFVSRFREALYCYSNVFDMLGTLWGDRVPERLNVERNPFYRNIVNIVACEGAERVDRPETYKQWHARIAKAGFEPLPIPSTIISRSKSHVKKHYHKDFLIQEDAAGWMLMGWKGRITYAASAWKRCLV